MRIKTDVLHKQLSAKSQANDYLINKVECLTTRVEQLKKACRLTTKKLSSTIRQIQKNCKENHVDLGSRGNQLVDDVIRDVCVHCEDAIFSGTCIWHENSQCGLACLLASLYEREDV